MKFIIDNIALIALTLVSGFALLLPSLMRTGAKVSTLQATQLINKGKTLILDVRDPEQFATAHVRDAKNIPLKDLGSRIGELDKFKAKTVVVICASGVQSAKAALQLHKAQFAEVYSLNGGLAAWQAQGLPVAK